MRKGSDKPGAVPPELVDAYFDGELDAAARADFHRRLGEDLAACREVVETRRIISELRAPVETPDLTPAIMARLHRGFLPARVRRMVSAGRVAVAATLLLALVGYGLAKRWQPGIFEPARTSPVTEVVRSSERDAAAGARQVRGVLMRARPGEQVYQAAALVPGRVVVRTFPDGAGSGVMPGGSGGPDAEWNWAAAWQEGASSAPIWSAEWRGGLLRLPEGSGSAPR